ncbi:MAG: hypothetical protein ABIG84_07810 [archaeon]
MDKKLFFPLFVLVMLVSGCSGSSIDYDPNAGAVLRDAAFDLPKVYDDDETALMFDVVNVGGKSLSNVDVYVYGPTMGTGTEVWNPNSTGGLTLNSGGYLSGSITGVNLPPPDPSIGTPGGSRSFEIVFDPANVLDGVEIPTTFYIGLCFPYSTSTITQVEVTSKNEIRATGVRGSRTDTINAAGPIHLNVQGEGNIRAGGIVPLVFKVNNVGGGFPTLATCGVDIATTNRNEVSINVTVDGLTTGIDCNSAGPSGNVKIRNDVGTFFCTYTPTTTSTAPRRTYSVKATATYNYYLTKPLTVTNIGSSLS